MSLGFCARDSEFNTQGRGTLDKSTRLPVYKPSDQGEGFNQRLRPGKLRARLTN